VDCGVNFFDSAEAYGNGYSEELIGEALTDVRSKIIIASKVATGHLGAADLRAACEASLKRLATDYIDIYYIHWPSRTVPLAETIGALNKLRDEGKIRHIGLSNFGVGDLTDVLQHGQFIVNELPYNLLWRAIEDEIIPMCARHRISITAYMPLMQGLLTGKFATVEDVPPMRSRTRHFSPQRSEQSRHGEPGAEEETFAAIAAIRGICTQAGLPMAQAAMAWLLHKQSVASVIVGVRNPQQVVANVSAASLRLSPDMVRALDQATEPLKRKLGPNPDMWQNTTNSRFR
jgi:aryl-alcohol dehydrogenase-like predicted oxidoreductase